MDISSIFIRSDKTIKDALEAINTTAQGILLMVDEKERFLRTVTDGDLRRALIKDIDLNTRLHDLSKIQSTYLTHYPTHKEALAVMDECGVDHLPIVDQSLKPLTLVKRKDLAHHVLLSIPHLGSEEETFVNEAFQSNWIAPLGPNVDNFESELASFVGVKAATAVISGTAAIHLALCVLDVHMGDTVFCSSFTFIASVNPVLYQGAIPVFIDSEPESWNMSPPALKRAMEDAEQKNQLPKAVIVVNLYGQSANFDEISKICSAYGVPIIEDAAESLGASYRGKASGTLGHMGIYSFNGNKIITTSGGGMLVSDDEELINKARFLSTQAKDDAPYYLHTQLGFNYRMSNVLAGIGRGQLKVLPQRVDARRRVFESYRQELSDLDVFDWMPEAEHCVSTRWLSTACIQGEGFMNISEELILKLAEYGIEARRTWNPMHRQPLLEKYKYYPHKDDCSVSDTLFDKGICLPSASNMSESAQLHVITAIRAFFNSI